METGRRHARARLVRTASTAARLADVVRRARLAARATVVSKPCLSIVARQKRRDRSVRAQSVSQRSAPLHSCDLLPVSFHDGGGTSTNRRVVETPGAGRIFAGRVARTVSVKIASG